MSDSSRVPSPVAAVGFVVGAFAAAGVAVALQGSDIQQFYTTELTLPPWAPPAWVFGPVWSVLYALIGIAAWRVWRRDGWTRTHWIWVAQLALNAAWNPLFFNVRNVTLALADIVVLFGVIVLLDVRFFERDRLAGAMLVPYALWVGFAMSLTLAVWILNPALR